MNNTDSAFEDWLTQADLPTSRLTAEVRALLHAAFRFRQQQGHEYCSRRLLCHLLLHCHCGLKVAQVARRTGFDRATASRQQGLSSKEVIQATHRRFLGRPYGKLLPRYAGPVAQFLCDHPNATHYDTLDFLARAFGVRVSLQALHHFLNTYGLDRTTRRHAQPSASRARPRARPRWSRPAAPPRARHATPTASPRSTRPPPAAGTSRRDDPLRRCFLAPAPGPPLACCRQRLLR